jgi:Rieske Fe-S protein
LNVARHYGDWLKPQHEHGEIAPGEGRVVREGLLPVAVYVDAAGKEQRRSAVCPHLGCIVAWNSAEHSWDCPCHGSRFAADGTCLIGPSTDDLKALD